MRDNLPVATIFPYTPEPAKLGEPACKPPATKAQPPSLKVLVDQLFPCNHLDNQSATVRKNDHNSINKKQGEWCISYTLLEKRIIVMAKRWDYSPEELKWALSQSKIKPHAWTLVCTADEILTCV